MKGSRCVMVLMACVLAGCAQVREPQGGPKDTSSPKLVSSEPANGSTFFTGRRIVLHFDEHVKLDRVRERLLISPPLSEQPEVVVAHGSDVVITLKALLAPNTTYTFNIGEAVLDLSEGNPAAGLSFVVSTGAYVDSLAIGGQVLDAFSGLPAADVLVLLHADRDTGDVRTIPPAYFTRTDASGNFRLTHLRSGAMHINALRDKNADYRFDLPNEDIAFLDSAIDPLTAGAQHLFLFRPRSRTQFVSEARVMKDRGWRLAMARPAGRISLYSLDRTGGDLLWWPEWNASRDTVVMWPSDTTLLNGQRFDVLEDEAVLDTLTYRVTSSMPFNLTVTADRDPEKGMFSLVSSRPIASIDLQYAELRVDSVQVPMVASLDTNMRRTVHLALKASADNKVSLLLYPKAITDMQGGTNDTTRLELGMPAPGTTGRLTVSVEPDSGLALRGPLVLQLLTEQGRTLRQALADSLPFNVLWQNVTPGSYGLKLIEDMNGDGGWSTGSFAQGRQPERVRLLTDPVIVRSGWSVETTWQVPTER